MAKGKKQKINLTRNEWTWGIFIMATVIVGYGLFIICLSEDYKEGTVQYFKYLFIIASAISGVIALVNKTKDKKNNLTTGGKLLLFIILVSGMLSFLSQAMEYSIDLEKEEETNIKTDSILTRTSKILSDFIRVTNPIDEFSVYYEINFPLEETFASKYKKRVEVLRSNLIETPPGVKNPLIEEAGIMSGGSNNPEQMYTLANFKDLSKYFPNSSTEKTVRYNLSRKRIRYAFFKDSLPLPINQEKLTNACDLLLQTSSDIKHANNKYSHWLAIYTSESGITIRSMGFNTVRKNQWVKNSGKISSLYDLLGGYMVIYDQGGNMYYDFKVLKIRFAPGKTMLIDTKDIKSYFSESGRLYHYYKFPDIIDSLNFEIRTYPEGFY